MSCHTFTLDSSFKANVFFAFHFGWHINVHAIKRKEKQKESRTEIEMTTTRMYKVKKPQECQITNYSMEMEKCFAYCLS